MKVQADIVVWGIGTPRTLRVYWTLDELGLDYRTERIVTRTAEMDRAEFIAVSPGKKIPAVQHGEIELTESGAITRFLMDTYSTEQWSPAERAQIDRWTFFALMEIDATALYVIRRHEGLPNIYGNAPHAVSSSYEYANRQIRVLDDALKDGRSYVLGDRFSEADIHLGTCLGWAGLLGMELPDRTAAYKRGLQTRSAYKTANVANASATKL